MNATNTLYSEHGSLTHLKGSRILLGGLSGSVTIPPGPEGDNFFVLLQVPAPDQKIVLLNLEIDIVGDILAVVPFFNSSTVLSGATLIGSALPSQSETDVQTFVWPCYGFEGPVGQSLNLLMTVGSPESGFATWTSRVRYMAPYAAASL